MNKLSGIITVAAILLFISLIGGCMGDSEYERAGKEFGTWVNTDPNGWTDTQKNYFNDFMDWADKN